MNSAFLPPVLTKNYEKVFFFKWQPVYEKENPEYKPIVYQENDGVWQVIPASNTQHE